MAEKNSTQALIGGKVFTLSGYESEEYLQKIAIYINNKMVDLNKTDGYKRLSPDVQSTLLEINIADDFYKAKQQVSTLEGEMKKKDKELYDLKDEVISTKLKLEGIEKLNADMKEENHELQKQIVKLKTELEELLKK